MPITKSRLTKTEEATYVLSLKKLWAGGIDVEIPNQSLKDSSALEIVPSPFPGSYVDVGLTGGVYYAISVRIRALRAHQILRDCRLETGWDDLIEMQSFQSRQPIYQLGCLKYPVKEVLNDKIENSLHFYYRHQEVEGVILFAGVKPIPEHCREGMSVPFQLKFLNQAYEEISVEGQLFVGCRRNSNTAVARRSSSLFEPCETSLWTESVDRDCVERCAGGEQCHRVEEVQLTPEAGVLRQSSSR